MLDAASRRSGARMLMVSSLDEDHPGDNAIDGNDRTYWMSTGLYPQELLVELCFPAWVSSMCVSSTHVRQLRIEGCHEEQPVNFQLLIDGDLGDLRGEMQVQELACPAQDRPIRYIRMMILSGWHDFCSVHRLQVKATKPTSADMPVDDRQEEYSTGEGDFARQRSNESGMARRRLSSRTHSDLKVDIPPTHIQAKHSREDDAPRVAHPHSEGAPWVGSGGGATQSNYLGVDGEVLEDPLSPRPILSRAGRKKNEG